ncbi:MAG: hypothetical protein HY898_15610 [Deltaproteobacteria bacterium]|nr:hypothetical protein [Deltaproteobacteria bacterium]
MATMRACGLVLGALAMVALTACSDSSDSPAPATDAGNSNDAPVGTGGGGGTGGSGGAGGGGGLGGSAGATDSGQGEVLDADVANGALQAYAQAALQNDTLVSTSADGAVGAIVYTSYLTLDTAVAVGACARGDGGVTVVGGDGTTRTLTGAGMCAGAAATITGSNFSSLVFAAGAALVGSFCYELPAMPADAAAAQVEFDNVFGASSRHGVVFDKATTIDPKFDAGVMPSGKAFYGTAVQKLTSLKFANGSIDATLFVGVMSVNDKVRACHLSAVGSYVAKL